MKGETRSILWIKRSEHKLLKITHILESLDSGTLVKNFEKENYLLIANNRISTDKHFMEMGATLHC